MKNDFHQVVKNKKGGLKILRVWTRRDEILEFFEEFFPAFLIKISMENCLFK